ncbi:hypothetical protein Acsp05_69350 [Actinokineospora sp. NBRC 105648]|nr:hypothetical protein Acsp05_69350 [Actinokineospora sp. NBRC 105648]
MPVRAGQGRAHQLSGLSQPVGEWVQGLPGRQDGVRDRAESGGLVGDGHTSTLRVRGALRGGCNPLGLKQKGLPPSKPGGSTGAGLLRYYDCLAATTAAW